MVGRIYKIDHYVISEKEIFSCLSNDAPGAWPVCTPRGTVVRIYKEDHYTSENMKALGIVVLEKKIVLCFPILSL